jgi:hypothetical protein
MAKVVVKKDEENPGTNRDNCSGDYRDQRCNKENGRRQVKAPGYRSINPRSNRTAF